MRYRFLDIFIGIALLLSAGCYRSYWNRFVANCSDDCFKTFALTPGEHIVGKTHCYMSDCTCTCKLQDNHPRVDGHWVQPKR